MSGAPTEPAKEIMQHLAWKPLKINRPLTRLLKIHSFWEMAKVVVRFIVILGFQAYGKILMPLINKSKPLFGHKSRILPKSSIMFWTFIRNVLWRILLKCPYSPRTSIDSMRFWLKLKWYFSQKWKKKILKFVWNHKDPEQPKQYWERKTKLEA